ncbi:MAG: gliding motility-associated C-terminal domain-containing protein, partial [Bacteroidia bacterium]|nr:gliding motility-associated C-terminal domain-containing protein [Bacteroidia bacterium]MDW8333897.1 gliding motility-associated C-terminal domain-containing protein [Bacteroidia bacterium]
CYWTYDVVKVEVGPGWFEVGDSTFCRSDFRWRVRLPSALGNYVWSTGDTGREAEVSSAGEYWVELRSPEGCVRRDTFRASVGELKLSLPGRVRFCDVSSGELDASRPDLVRYRWSTGDTTATISVNVTGDYVLRVWNEQGCEVRDTVRVEFLSSPLWTGPLDTFACFARRGLWFRAPEGMEAFWNDEAGPTVYVRKAGRVRLRLSNGRCASEYEILVRDSCAAEASEPPEVATAGFSVFPDAFTPNGDGLNDEFMPLFGTGYKRYMFEVYDRWGELAFRTRDPGVGWDGNIRKAPAPEGVYVWKFSGELFDGRTFEKQGTVTLLR